LAAGLEGELEVGDIIAVYVDDTFEPIMLGKILKTQYTITLVDAVYSWMGRMEVGDEVILVHKLDPTANGIASSFWQLRDPANAAAQFPIWVEDIRAVKIKLTLDKVRRGRSAMSPSNPIDQRWEISPSERERFMVTLPLVLVEGENDDPHKEKRRPAEFETGDADSSDIDEVGAGDSGGCIDEQG
jgi:hypothetical protein